MKYDTHNTTMPQKAASWWKGFWDSTGSFFARLAPTRPAGLADCLGARINHVMIDSQKIFMLRMRQSAGSLVCAPDFLNKAQPKKSASKKKKIQAPRTKKTRVNPVRKSR